MGYVSLRQLFEGVFGREEEGENGDGVLHEVFTAKLRKDLEGMVEWLYLCPPAEKRESSSSLRGLVRRSKCRFWKLLKSSKSEKKFWQEWERLYICTPNRKTLYKKSVLRFTKCVRLRAWRFTTLSRSEATEVAKFFESLEATARNLYDYKH